MAWQVMAKVLPPMATVLFLPPPWLLHWQRRVLEQPPWLLHSQWQVLEQPGAAAVPRPAVVLLQAWVSQPGLKMQPQVPETPDQLAIASPWNALLA